MKSSNRVKMKKSNVERVTNWLIVLLFCFQLVLCFICAICNGFWLKQKGQKSVCVPFCVCLFWGEAHDVRHVGLPGIAGREASRTISLIYTDFPNSLLQSDPNLFVRLDGDR